jgi:hypothetical protein
VLLLSGFAVLASAACTGAPLSIGESSGVRVAVTQPDPHAFHVVPGPDALAEDGPAYPSAYLALGAITVNVTVDEQTISPAQVAIPSGAKVRLVLRNRGSQEHHFHIAGLNPTEMLWLVKDFDSGAPVISTGPDDHSAHHGIEMAPYHVCTARGGVCPTGLDVHAHAAAGDVDVIMFTTADKGTFAVTCPLHPNLKGTVVVF